MRSYALAPKVSDRLFVCDGSPQCDRPYCHHYGIHRELEHCRVKDCGCCLTERPAPAQGLCPKGHMLDQDSEDTPEYCPVCDGRPAPAQGQPHEHKWLRNYWLDALETCECGAWRAAPAPASGQQAQPRKRWHTCPECGAGGDGKAHYAWCSKQQPREGGRP